MLRPCIRLVLRVGALGAVVLTLAACTKGGQFDPTVMLQNDMFSTKRHISGTREPVFPNGVPGVATGIPADLYKGYQPPPDQQAAGNPDQDAANIGAAPTPLTPPDEHGPRQAAAERPSAHVEARRRVKPKAKVARAQPAHRRTVIEVAPKAQPKAAAAKPSPSGQTFDSIWPAPPSTNAAQQGSASQSIWPAPPPPSGAQQGASSQSVWPAPPATSSASPSASSQ